MAAGSILLCLLMSQSVPREDIEPHIAPGDLASLLLWQLCHYQCMNKASIMLEK